MATPTYDSKKLFSYQDSQSNWRTEGVVMVPDYSKVTQTLHFNGENGNRYLDHGYADQKWYYRGYLWASNLSGLVTAVKAIQTYVDNDPGDTASYKPLVDTFGNSFPVALVTKLTKQVQRISADGWLADVVVEVDRLRQRAGHGRGFIVSNTSSPTNTTERPFRVTLGGTYGTEATPGAASRPTDAFTYAQWLEPVHIAHKGNGGISELRLIGAWHPEQATGAVKLHQCVQVRDARGETATGPTDSTTGDLIFDGVVVKKHLVWQGSEEHVEFVCYSTADYLLHRIIVHGQLRLGHQLEQQYVNGGVTSPISVNVNNRSQVVTIDTHCVFNPGLHNRHPQQIANDNGGSDDQGNDASGPPFYAFDRPGRDQADADGNDLEALHWTLSTAIGYLMSVSPVASIIDPQAFTQVKLNALVGGTDPVLADVNCEGKTLLAALTELLEPLGFGFFCDLVPDAATGLVFMNFYKQATGSSQKTIDFSPRGTQANKSSANCISLDLTIDSTPVVNCLTGVGAAIVHTTLAETNPPPYSNSDTDNPPMTLVQGWKSSDLQWGTLDGSQVNSFDLTFRKNYCNPSLISSDHDNAYGVGRLWMVNCGEVPWSNLEDLTTDLNYQALGGNSIDMRKLERPELYTQSSAGGQITQEDVQVEMSFDSGQTWGIAEKTWYKVLPEAMGIVFSEPRLEKLGEKLVDSNQNPANYWQSLHDSKLQIRVLCGVKSDQHLVQTTYNDGSACPLATARLYENDGYRLSKFNRGDQRQRLLHAVSAAGGSTGRHAGPGTISTPSS